MNDEQNRSAQISGIMCVNKSKGRALLNRYKEADKIANVCSYPRLNEKNRN